MFEEIERYVFTVLISIKKQNFGRNDRSLVSSLLPNEPKKVERIRARNVEEPDESTVRSHNARILILRVSTFHSFSLFSFFFFFSYGSFYTTDEKKRDRTCPRAFGKNPRQTRTVEYWLHIRCVYSRSTLVGAHAAAAMTPGIRPLSYFTPFRAIKVTPSFFVHVTNPLRNLYDSLAGNARRRTGAPRRFDPFASRRIEPRAFRNGDEVWAWLTIRPALRFRLQPRVWKAATIDEVLLNGAALKVLRRRKFSAPRI